MSKKNYIDECLERASKATPGPWRISRADRREGGKVVGSHDWVDGIVSISVELDEGIVETDSGCYPPKEEDAQFIAHARTDVPELARRIKEACEELEAAFFNHEVDPQCQCCLNNKSIFKQLTKIKLELEAPPEG